MGYRFKYRTSDNVVVAFMRGGSPNVFDDATHGTSVVLNMKDVPAMETVTYDATPGSEKLDPIVPDLAANKATKIAEVDAEARAKIIEHFPDDTQRLLLWLLDEGRAQSWATRITHIEQVTAWINAVLGTRDTAEDSINAAADQPALDAVTWDFSAHDGTVPSVTVRSARDLN